MPNLTKYLQQEFINHSPEGWICHKEKHLLSSKLENKLGYKPQADILMESIDKSKRLWIEFEISRADPVANHTNN